MRPVYRRKWGVVASVTLWLFAACSCSPLRRPLALPDMPRPALQGFLRSIGEQVQGAYEEAQAKPREAFASGRLGMILHAYEQYESAAVCYQRARLLEPGSFRWAYYLGTVWAALGRHGESVVPLREALRLNPGYLPARLKLAQQLLASGQPDESGKMYELVLKQEPRSAAAHYGLGRILWARGELASALAHYRKACEFSEGFRAAHYALALAYRDVGEIAKSREQFALYQKSQASPPPLPGADALLDAVQELKIGPYRHFTQGHRLQTAGQLEPALVEYQRALELDPQFVPAHVNLIAVYGALGAMEKAEQHYRRAVQINPNLEDSHYNFGVVLVMQGRDREAAEAFRQAIEINPLSAEAHNNLAYMLERQGRRAEALRHYRLALENQPNYRLAHFHLGQLLQAQGKHRQAIDHFLQTLAPEDERTPQFMYSLADAYLRAGHREKAIYYARLARQRAASVGQIELAGLIERDLQALEQRAGLR